MLAVRSVLPGRRKDVNDVMTLESLIHKLSVQEPNALGGTHSD